MQEKQNKNSAKAHCFSQTQDVDYWRISREIKLINKNSFLNGYLAQAERL